MVARMGCTPAQGFNSPGFDLHRQGPCCFHGATALVGVGQSEGHMGAVHERTMRRQDLDRSPMRVRPWHHQLSGRCDKACAYYDRTTLDEIGLTLPISLGYKRGSKRLTVGARVSTYPRVPYHKLRPPWVWLACGSVDAGRTGWSMCSPMPKIRALLTSEPIFVMGKVETKSIQSQGGPMPFGSIVGDGAESAIRSPAIGNAAPACRIWVRLDDSSRGE